MDPLRSDDPENGRKATGARACLRRLLLMLALVMAGALSAVAVPALASLIADPGGNARPVSAHAEAVPDHPLDADDVLRGGDEEAHRISLEKPRHSPVTFGGADEDAQSPTAVAVLYEFGGSHRPPIHMEQRRECLCSNPPERSYDAQAPPHG